MCDQLLSKEKPPATKNQEKLKRFKKVLEKSIKEALDMNGLSEREIEVKKRMHPFEIKRQQKKQGIIDKLEIKVKEELKQQTEDRELLFKQFKKDLGLHQYANANEIQLKLIELQAEITEA